MNPCQADIRKVQQELLHRALCEAFAHKMAVRLDAHAHVGNFMEWIPTEMELIGEVQHRLGTLGKRTRREQVSTDCADIANMLLRFSQLYGS